MIFYFSGCGNSRYVSETLTAGLNDTLVFIPEAVRENHFDYTLAEGESLGFVFPIYAWQPPRLVLDFIEKMNVKVGSSTDLGVLDYVYFVCTCGAECGLVEKVMRKALLAKGWALSSCFSVKMPETFIAMAGFKLDSEEIVKRKYADAEATLNRNLPRLLNKEHFSEIYKGAAAWFKTYVINHSFNRMATNDKKYQSSDQCIGCGKCEEVCPLNNITLESGRPVWNGNCTMCMACYHHCPVNAVQNGKATVGKGQYYFGK